MEDVRIGHVAEDIGREVVGNAEIGADLFGVGIDGVGGGVAVDRRAIALKPDSIQADDALQRIGDGQARGGVQAGQLLLAACAGLATFEIRASEEFADIPVAVFSCSVSPKEKNTLAAFKAIFITKPSELDEFLKVGKRIKELALAGKARSAMAAL